MTPDFNNRVYARLEQTGASNQTWALAIVAAMEGPEELDAYLDNTKTQEIPSPASASSNAARPEPPGIYVQSLTVEGFRGIGGAATLTFSSGPGLTLVVGRNGSGKSSFAEGLELLLTDDNYRWSGRPKAWQDGWRNLHAPQRVSLKAGLLVEGQGDLTVTRQWTTGKLTESESGIVQDGRVVDSLDSDTWAAPLATFRPFLSYNELGSLLEDGPSKLYDALSGVLGLDEMVEVQTWLANARKSRATLVEQAKETARQLTDLIASLGPEANDERLRAASEALRWPRVNFARLDALLTGATTEPGSELTLLELLKGLPRVDLATIRDLAEGLLKAERSCVQLAGSSAQRARERASLLEQAVRVHESHQDNTCPVCGTADALTESWASRTKQEIAALRDEARACEAAESMRRDRIRSAHGALQLPPQFLAQAAHLPLASIAAARREWLTWAEGRTIQSAAALAAHLTEHVEAFAAAVTNVAEDAAIEARKRQDLWQPIASRIAEWMPVARSAQAAMPQVTQLKEAEAWWKDASSELRDERFAPIADRAIAVWSQLRLRSNVDLGGIELEGSAQRRKVTLNVTVDGTEAQALGVMSQGELHSLALSLFLPRATLPESPFRFVWIDDPVQSMDPARVEGLARVLAETAKTRQVVVFTHDDRLPEATRRLGIAATILAVTRRANSVVEVRTVQDPVTTHLDDARALVLTKELPGPVASRVVPGFCRAAIEAACMDVVRRRRLGRGDMHDDVEELLGANARTHPLMALALFDDARRTNDVLARLNRTDRSFADALQACKLGTHTEYDGDVDELVRSAERLSRYVLKECR